MSPINLPEIRSHGAGASLQGLAYFGDREGWHIALSVNRDSDALDRSNWDVITADVLSVPDDAGAPTDACNGCDHPRARHAGSTCRGYFPDDPGDSDDTDCDCAEFEDDGLGDAAIERMGNDLCGWVDHLLVRPGSSAEARAIEWREKLEDYLIADENHYSALEYAEEWCLRCDSATREEHPTARCGKFRSREDARDIEYRWAHRHDAR